MQTPNAGCGQVGSDSWSSRPLQKGTKPNKQTEKGTLGSGGDWDHHYRHVTEPVGANQFGASSCLAFRPRKAGCLIVITVCQG